MNKKQLAVAIACAMCVMVNQQVYSANDIEIVSGSIENNIAGSLSFTSTDDTAQLGIDNITTNWAAPISETVSQNEWNSPVGETVTVSTAELGTNNQSGDITFTENLTHAGPVRLFLNLNAHNDINLNGTISGDYSSYRYNSIYDHYNGSLSLTLNPDSDALNGGVVNLNGTISGNVHTTVNGALEIGATGTYSLDNHWGYASLTAESINVADGGNFDFTKGHLTLTNSDLIIGAGGLLGENFALETNSGRRLTLANDGVLTIDAGASFTLNSGRLEVGSIVNNGSFNYGVWGDLTLTNSGLTIGADGLLGNTFITGAGRDLTLANNNILTIDAGASFDLYYGSLEVGSIINNGSFKYSHGALTLTNSGLTIGTNGLLGNNVDLSGWRTLSVSGDVNVEDGATLLVDNDYNAHNSVDNRFLSNLNNQGTIAINNARSAADAANGDYFYMNPFGTELTVDGTLINDGAAASTTLNGGALIVGGITNLNGGSFTFNSGYLGLTNSGLTVGVDGALGDNVSLGYKDTLAVAGNIVIDNGATLSMDANYVTLSAASISNSGNFNFNSGNLELTNSGLTVGSGGLLGDNVTLSSQRRLVVAGDVPVDSAATLTFDHNNGGHFLSNLNNQGTVSVISNSSYLGTNFDGNLTVDGVITNDGAGASLILDRGVLTAGAINNINDGSFDFNSGQLELTNSGMTVGSGGLLSDNVTLDRNRVLSVAGDVVVNSGASLTMDTADRYRKNHFLSNLNNQGTVSIINTDNNMYSGQLIVNGINAACL